MALIDKASLLMVPSTYEDGTLYNILPSGNKAPDETGNHNGYDQTRADFTFSRGSNLAATRVNADGLIEKGRENLLLQSNQFDTTWVKGTGDTSLSVTSGQNGYDGSNDAWLIDELSNDQAIYQTLSTSNVQAFSVYAKAGTNNWVRLGIGGGSFSHAYFDLENGALGNTLNVVDSAIETIGNGWYRCSVTFNKSANAVYIYPSEANDSAGTNGSIYIQDAQLELGLVSTPVIRTGATTATAGVLENTPRIDYSSGAGSLKLEPQRTNAVTNSEYYAGYPQTRITLTHNSTTSPEGFINATKMVETTDNGLHFLAITGSVTSSANAAFSIFAKQGENQFLQVLFGTAQTSPDAYANVDLSNGTYNDYNMVSFDTEDYGNGWYRVFGVVNSLTTSLGFYIASVQSKTAARAETYAGDGTSGFYIYGAQLESSASYPSSYVPTHGSAATRGADSTYPPSSYITNNVGNSGSWFMEYEDFRFVVTGTSASTNRLGDGSNSNCLGMAARVVNNDLRINFIKAESGVVTTLADHDITGAFKCVFVWNGSNLSLYVNGSQRYSAAGFTQPSWSSLVFNNTSREGFQMLKQNILFDEALTQSEAETLTTL